MTAYSRVLEARYVDSVVLMRLAQSLAHQDGIADAAAMMGTDANKTLLREGDFLDGDVTAGADDLVVAVRAQSAQAAEVALARIDELLAAGARSSGLTSVSTLEDALSVQPHSNLAVISLPGEYAAAEARRALEAGLHVFLFSSNVTVEDERELKQLAQSRGLLCMGPDCGTAIIAGKGLGFANAVRRGPVGIVGASGTGIQEVSSLLDRFGVGISHAIGCGSRDLSAAIGGRTALAGLDALLTDDSTEAIVLVSKPPDPKVAARLRAHAAGTGKPVLFGFLGDPESPTTLEKLALSAAAAVGRTLPELPAALTGDEIADLRVAQKPAQRYLRGLFAGGTLAYEAQLVLRDAGLTIASNAPIPGSPPLAEATRSKGHTIVDLGSEEFTRGRPHPMIDSRIRRARLLQEASDPDVAVVLLDFVLGYGAAADPAGDLAEAIATARQQSVVVLAHVSGTEADPQRLDSQEQILRTAGALVLPTNAAMARTAAALVQHVLREPAPVAAGARS